MNTFRLRPTAMAYVALAIIFGCGLYNSYMFWKRLSTPEYRTTQVLQFK